MEKTLKENSFFKKLDCTRCKQKPCTGAFGTVDATRPQSGTETQAECIEGVHVNILCAIFFYSETVHQYAFAKEGSKKLQLYLFMAVFSLRMWCVVLYWVYLYKTLFYSELFRLQLINYYSNCAGTARHTVPASGKTRAISIYHRMPA